MLGVFLSPVARNPELREPFSRRLLVLEPGERPDSSLKVGLSLCVRGFGMARVLLSGRATFHIGECFAHGVADNLLGDLCADRHSSLAVAVGRAAIQPV